VRRLLLMRGGVVVLAAIGAVIAFTSGEEIFGALLTGLVVANVLLIAFFASRGAWQRHSPPEPQPPPRRPH
jgi:hypothetical protein